MQRTQDQTPPGRIERTVATPPTEVLVHRALGALIGAAVGDALGAPFEFRPGGGYRTRFPEPVLDGRGEMVGNRTWEPGEFTDDTQMAVLLGQSLADQYGFDAAEVFDRFRAWLRSNPKDVGISTRAVLGSAGGWDTAAATYFRANPRGAAGNGSLMRTMPAALHFAASGREVTMRAAQAQSDLTHGDPAAAAGCALYHELVRVALLGEDPLAALPAALDAIVRLGIVDPVGRTRYDTMLAPGWEPTDPGPANGSVWGALAQTVWSVRQGGSYADMVTRVIDLGDDADTVGAICGGLAGAIHGMGAIPSRWTAYLHGYVLGRRYELDDLQVLARRLVIGRVSSLFEAEAHVAPVEVVPGFWVGNHASAEAADPKLAVISLCRMQRRLADRPLRRTAYLVDQRNGAEPEDDRNPAIQAVLDDVLDTIDAFRAAGQPVLVHCWGGRSRTGLVLRSWLVRHEGLTAEQATAKAKAIWPATDTWNPTFTEALAARAGSAP